jgi:FkbM family methyltransferase
LFEDKRLTLFHYLTSKVQTGRLLWIMKMRFHGLIPPRLEFFALKCLSSLKRSVLGHHTDALLIQSRNGLLLVDVEDQYVGRHLAYEGEYGRSEIDRLRAYLSADDNLLIVGAHVGAIAIPISRYCRSVTAIEANPRSFQLLQMNISINGRENVRAIHIAASDKSEELEFVANTINPGGSKRMPVVRDRIYFLDSPEVTKVRGERLDNVLRGMRFEIVFMDIEGSEYFALRGMQDILSHTKSLFVEFVPHHLRNVSCVTVEQFVSPIRPHFSSIFVPSKKFTGSTDNCCDILQRMYERDESDEGVIFSKSESSPEYFHSVQKCPDRVL